MTTNQTWADIIQNNDGFESELIVLPQEVVIKKGGGYEERVSYKKKEMPDKTVKYFKITECTQRRKVRRRISKHAVQRRKLEKFGDCKMMKQGQCEKGITETCPDHVLFEWAHERKEEDEEENQVLKQLVKQNVTDALIKEIIPVHLIEKTEKTKIKRVAHRPIEHNAGQMEDTPTIRILDLPTNTTFHDLLDLVKPFENKRANLPRDPDGINANRGVAYVSFNTHAQAERAKNSLNGHPYGNLILRTEWSRNYANWMAANEELMKQRKAAGGGITAGGGPRRRRFVNSKAR